MLLYTSSSYTAPLTTDSYRLRNQYKAVVMTQSVDRVLSSLHVLSCCRVHTKSDTARPFEILEALLVKEFWAVIQGTCGARGQAPARVR